MEIFSTGLFLFIWRLVGTGIIVVGGIALVKSAAESWQSVTSTRGWRKVWSILDEIIIGIVAMAVVYIVFVQNDLGALITLLARLISWAWGFVVEILRSLGVPL